MRWLSAWGIRMNFGIITLVSDNYGNKYQNYAVEQIFSEYGDVVTYGLENLYHAPASTGTSTFVKLNPAYIREVLISRPMYQYDINRVDRGIIHNLIYAKKNSSKLIELRKKRSEHFKRFADQNMHISTTVLNRENVTKKWADDIEYFICGSDQIWNPNYTTTSELAFCSFAPEKTICLSPSFGVSEIPSYRKEEYSDWLSQIKSLSVRETAGQKIIKKLTGRDAEVLLDPTMVLPIEKWERLCKEPEEKLPKHYIVCYFLGRIDKSYCNKIQEFSKKKGLPVVILFDITTPKYYTYDPAEVLYVIKHADYVLTDSFHGSVFSILFHKNFYVFTRNEGKVSLNSRIETLLEKFDLNSRLFDNRIEDVSPQQWDMIDTILDRERIRTKNYIQKAMDTD